MNYRYRVKGHTDKSFILRGVIFRVGSEIDNYIMEQELVFVQEHCKLTEVVDMQSQKNAPKPIPTNSDEIYRGVKDEQSAKATIRTNKVKPTAKV